MRGVGPPSAQPRGIQLLDTLPRVLLPLATAGAIAVSGGCGEGEISDGGCDLERGQRVFAKCAPCHAPGTVAAQVVAPDLRGLIGRRAGRAAGFKYSRAMRETEFTWSRERLAAYLEDPPAYVPQNTMAFAGLKRADDRDAVICYLEGLFDE